MSTEVVVGIDCGTSHVKYSTVTMLGREVETHRERSPSFRTINGCDSAYAAAIWKQLQQRLAGLEQNAIRRAQQTIAVSIAAISPVLVIFDLSDADCALAMPYWPIPHVDGAARGLARTIRRVRHLRSIAAGCTLKRPIVCDLLGYLNYRLTGRLCLNTITAGELGFRNETEVRDLFCLRPLSAIALDLLAPSDPVGAQRDGSTEIGKLAPSICAGSPDSFAAALTTGPRSVGSKLIYLGTFGSVLEVQADLSRALQRTEPQLPYCWVLSSPHFGPMVEAYANAYFPANSISESLRRLEQMALRAKAGANGLFFHLPFWSESGAERGAFGFSGRGRPRAITSTLAARAVLESLAYLVRARLGSSCIEASKLAIAGGGAASPTWRQVLADALGSELSFLEHPGGAWSASVVAAVAAGARFVELIRSAAGGKTVPNPANHAATMPTALRAAEWYLRVP